MGKKLYVFEYIRGKPFLSLIAGGVIFVLGVLLSKIPTMIVSQGWPITDGIIIRRIYLGQSFREYDGDVYENFEAYIRYQYSVNGISYSSTAINSIDPFYYPSSIADRYPEGKEVIVHYNPGDPSESVIEPGFVFTFDAIGIFPFLISGAGIYFIALGILELLKIRGKQN